MSAKKAPRKQFSPTVSKGWQQRVRRDVDGGQSAFQMRASVKKNSRRR